MLVLIDRISRLAVLAVTLSLCACATIDNIISANTRVDYKKGYEFDAIETVTVTCIMDADDAPLSPAEIERVDLALSRAIERRGITVVEDPASADAQVSWHVVTQEQSSMREYNAQAYYQCWRCGPAISSAEVKNYTEGTFVVDIIDKSLSKSVWRGVMKGRLAEEDRESLQQSDVDKAASEVFSKFPPGILIDGIY
jgi:hypothetical protein